MQFLGVSLKRGTIRLVFLKTGAAGGSREVPLQ